MNDEADACHAQTTAFRNRLNLGKPYNSACQIWVRLATSAIGMLLVAAFIVVTHKSNSPPTPGSSRDPLQREVQDLKSKVEQLMQEQIMPAAVLSQYGSSIGYICGVYRVGFPDQPPDSRTRFSGTGFLVGNGLVATNRHIAEPWLGDSEAENLIRHGAVPSLESTVVFFPGVPRPAKLSHKFVSETSDLALLRAENSEAIHALPVLPLAKSSPVTGQFVTVIGYPLGIAGMIAKSPPNLNKHLASRPLAMNVPSELAALSLIRPSVTFGHVGDIIADKLIYDAPTAHGASGGPVFNSKGEVVAVNTAYMHGFSGANIGISVKSLYQLLDEVGGVSTVKSTTRSKY